MSRIRKKTGQSISVYVPNEELGFWDPGLHALLAEKLGITSPHNGCKGSGSVVIRHLLKKSLLEHNLINAKGEILVALDSKFAGEMTELFGEESEAS